ncbi:hypothetical protein BDK51DRAFT_50738 [Blyttiomyces helicus]|uniref:Uncharacterized protein n=1 Tax=Blyttiomyces helicus TaxID=388810 RepID=A0A4P9W1P2_9FUNG|nr:hypothetical protein BDK51DRAFT_50738 [Blyttiomyces helicus]|eukprot:RKO86111.1 hypothetical protein BDK51DRAFT_50738 [Blyttiomyces helicus]
MVRDARLALILRRYRPNVFHQQIYTLTNDFSTNFPPLFQIPAVGTIAVERHTEQHTYSESDDEPAPVFEKRTEQHTYRESDDEPAPIFEKRTEQHTHRESDDEPTRIFEKHTEQHTYRESDDEPAPIFDSSPTPTSLYVFSMNISSVDHLIFFRLPFYFESQLRLWEGGRQMSTSAVAERERTTPRVAGSRSQRCIQISGERSPHPGANQKSDGIRRRQHARRRHNHEAGAAMSHPLHPLLMISGKRLTLRLRTLFFSKSSGRSRSDATDFTQNQAIVAVSISKG